MKSFGTAHLKQEDLVMDVIEDDILSVLPNIVAQHIRISNSKKRLGLAGKFIKIEFELNVEKDGND